MVDRFSAAALKLERANKHIEDLGAIVSALPDAYVSTIEPNEKLGQTIKYTPPDITKITSDMAVIIGDALHNLRTGIEYAYLGAVERHAPSALDCYTKFPTGQTRSEVESRLKGRGIDILSPKLFDRIVTNIKPYVVGGNCLIKMLHDLDVSDKHWLLIPLMRVATITDIIVEDERGHATTGSTYPINGDGPYFLDFPPNYTLKSKGKLTLDVVFDDTNIGLLKGMSVMSDLQDFSKIAAYIIQILNGV
jgi:hypothetical protein